MLVNIYDALVAARHSAAQSATTSDLHHLDDTSTAAAAAPLESSVLDYNIENHIESRQIIILTIVQTVWFPDLFIGGAS